MMCLPQRVRPKVRSPVEAKVWRARKALAMAARVSGRGDDAGDAALGAEHGRAGHAAAAASAMLVACHGRAELVAALHRLLVEPAEMSPGRADFDEPLQLRVMPVEIAAPSADMRNQQMPLRVRRIGRPEFLDRPGARLDRAAFHVLVPLDRAHMLARFADREIPACRHAGRRRCGRRPRRSCRTIRRPDRRQTGRPR